MVKEKHLIYSYSAPGGQEELLMHFLLVPEEAWNRDFSLLF
jgi:hypothetical protein